MITKVSEIKVQDIADYIRISELTEADEKFISTILNIVKEYINSYTGISIDQLDDYKEFIIVIYTLCEDMYDNRTLYIDSNSVNKVINNILSMHSVNLL